MSYKCINVSIIVCVCVCMDYVNTFKNVHPTETSSQ